jgi:hypothetical protein
MENFLSNFANVSKEVTSECSNVSIEPTFNGNIELTKGLLKQKFSFYARVYESVFDGYPSIDDWDLNEVYDVSFNGMPIDDIDKLKATLKDSGLKSVAEGLDVSSDVYKKAIANEIEKSKFFKAVFGEGAKMFDSLTEEEQSKVRLKHIIEHYDNVKANAFYMKEFLKLDENGNKVMPTLDELKAML